MDSVHRHGRRRRAHTAGVLRSWIARRFDRLTGGGEDPTRLSRARLVAVGVTAVALALVVCGCGGSATAESGFAGSSAEGSDAPDFMLRDQSGRLVSLAGQRGRWVVVTFLYTRCPDVCPLIANQLNEVLRQLGSERDRLRVLAVSVDPKGDTEKMVRWFIQKHHLLPQFRYLTGSAAQLQPIWKGYYVAAQVGSPDVSLHSAYELLLDPKGKPRLRYSAALQARDLLHDLRELGAVT
jgi:protein SCO1